MKRPFVLAHFAMTADGKISTRAGTPSRFTSVADKRRLLEARAEADAVLAGRGTVEADAMSMGISAKDLREARAARGLPPVPLRVIVSNAGRFDLDGKVFRYSASPLVIFSTTRMPERLRPEVARRAELSPSSGAGRWISRGRSKSCGPSSASSALCARAGARCCALWPAWASWMESA